MAENTHTITLTFPLTLQPGTQTPDDRHPAAWETVISIDGQAVCVPLILTADKRYQATLHVTGTVEGMMEVPNVEQ